MGCDLAFTALNALFELTITGLGVVSFALLFSGRIDRFMPVRDDEHD